MQSEAQDQCRIVKIVSGGQTGADRAALDWAIEHEIPHGGWCPKGRRAEDGLIDLRYALVETPLRNYNQRTEWNVRDSDGTVIFTIAAALSGGSKNTIKFAKREHRPCLHLSHTTQLSDAAALLRQFLDDHNIKVLNVAGSRASKEPTIGDFVRLVLSQSLLP